MQVYVGEPGLGMVHQVISGVAQFFCAKGRACFPNFGIYFFEILHRAMHFIGKVPAHPNPDNPHILIANLGHPVFGKFDVM